MPVVANMEGDSPNQDHSYLMTVSRCVLALFIAAVVLISPTEALAQEAGATVEEPELRDELLEMLDDWESLRDSLDRAHGYDQPMPPADSARMEELVEQNVDRLSDIIREHGFPGNSMVGEEGSQAIWVLTQHADGHLEFQRGVLSFMKEAVEENEVDPRHVAYLEDRVRIAQGRDQVYGTQVQFLDGMPRPFPIEDAEDVDERRDEMGLQPLEEYLRELREMQ